MEQRCHIATIWATWLTLPLLTTLAGATSGLMAGLIVLAAGIVAQVLYVRWFPALSRWLGYGQVTDSPVGANSTWTKPAQVTLYTASVCPFCPIVRERLKLLQREHALEIHEIDVTFRPEIVRSKGLRSVPVLEANGHFLVGNATSAQIADFLGEAGGAAVAGHPS